MILLTDAVSICTRIIRHHDYIVVFDGAYLVLEAEADMLGVVDGLHCTLEC